ncbi:MAG TPA: hypothetical protein VFS77_20015 [Pyrinomonadaceae bacterium]|nr:hypothetical protein [Pyrinomonadaceae bacterium]
MSKEENTIRQFLLGQLSEQEQEQVEDRIFTDPDFAEEVQIVEDELIADERAGKLTDDERRSFANKYSTKANQATIEFERAFGEFICTKTQSGGSVQELRADPQPHITRRTAPERTGFWQRLIPALGPAVVYPTAAVALVLLVAALWFLAPRYINPGDAPSREVIEAELARLNAPGAPPQSVLSTVDLEIAQRYGGAMTRITPRTTSPDGVLEFYLNLAEMSSRKYRAVIFDDRRKELFALSDLTAQDSDAGPRIRLVIPLKYLSRGDYQIDLSVANDDGGYDQVNSYAFRVVDPR